ncbi:phosphoglucomutase-2-like isoform X1 [Portunus trituberculatus]|uniref:phosphoglucomutase-2-like isoform X1 n=2 Tax=Portunus trituberculatus TaxID=210409 RepID=UPI001E1CB686|nr:phosphoglucomutase-2-like isoform X1 [Portunus trituberculatus]
MCETTTDTGNPSLNKLIEEWLRWDKNEKTQEELKGLVARRELAEVERLLSNRLLFGTAGLRGRMGTGYAQMNDLVIIQTSQGLAKYLTTVHPEAKSEGVVIGHDSRHNSHRFARLAAAAFLNAGVPVYLYSKIVPTPFVPFGVVQLGAAAGVMVTASHNPKEDNGYKVYWGNGAQIIPPHDTGIQHSIEENLEPWQDAWDTEKAMADSRLSDPLVEMSGKYFTKLSASMLDRDMNQASPVSFTVTAMHGVSHEYMEEAFRVCGFKPMVPVKEQMVPDPDFPTVKFPNPEEGKSALDLSFKTANENNSTVILANDPDADRLAVAEKQPNGQWKVFTGNEEGALLGWWNWQRCRRLSPHIPASDCYMVASTVSSKILRAIAKKEGFNFEETLTGFKWMGNVSHGLMKQGKTILFAFEEAIGFMNGSEYSPSPSPSSPSPPFPQVLDKDGISAAMYVAELATHLAKENKTLTDQLQEIYKMYGYHICNNSYYICHDQDTIRSMFKRMRNFSGKDTYPESVGNGRFKVAAVRDLTTGYDSSQPDKCAVLPVSSSSEMITFTFGNGCVLTLRTSGTEPKIKYYSEMCATPDQGDWKALEVELADLVNCVVEEMMQPRKNNLIPKAD